MEKRLTSALTLTAMLSGVVISSISCGETQLPGDDQNATSESASTEETTADPLADDLPDKNYGDADFDLLVRTERLYYLQADEENGDTLNDAVYKRNLTVEQRFDVKLNYHDVASDKSVFTKAVESSVMAGDRSEERRVGKECRL